MQTAAVKERSQALTQEGSDWHWLDGKLSRHQRQDWRIQEECDDCTISKNTFGSCGSSNRSC